MEAHTGLNVDETHDSSGTPKVPVASVVLAATSPDAPGTDPWRRKWRTIRPFHVTLSLDLGDSTGSASQNHMNTKVDSTLSCLSIINENTLLSSMHEYEHTTATLFLITWPRVNCKNAIQQLSPLKWLVWSKLSVKIIAGTQSPISSQDESTQMLCGDISCSNLLSV